MFVVLGAIIPTRPVSRAPVARVIVTVSPAKVPAAAPRNSPIPKFNGNLTPPSEGSNEIVDALMRGTVASDVEIDDTLMLENWTFPDTCRLGHTKVETKMLEVCRPVVRICRSVDVVDHCSKTASWPIVDVRGLAVP